MSFEDLFVRFWWLIFPLFGFLWAFVELAQSGRRSKRAMDLIQTYVEQGKEPPAELLDIAAGGESQPAFKSGDQVSGMMVVIFTAIAVGFGLISNFAQTQKTQEVFFALAAVFGVLALGFFLMAMFGPRPQK
jgi:hypothetical protein